MLGDVARDGNVEGAAGKRQGAEVGARGGIDVAVCARLIGHVDADDEARALLNTGFEPTAIICVNDITAVGALRELRQEGRPMPSLVLIDGGLGQLHAAAEALESLQIINQPLAAIAKRESRQKIEWNC